MMQDIQINRNKPWLLGMLGPELETELSISFFLTFGFFEATESGVSSFYNRKSLSKRN
jgi:hypothetical protein